MQGSVFGTIICTAVMDKLAKILYSEPTIAYRYNNTLNVLMLEMVGDVISVNKCSSQSVTSNATVISFMDMNKLSLSHTKCSKIHIGKNVMNVLN